MHARMLRSSLKNVRIGTRVLHTRNSLACRQSGRSAFESALLRRQGRWGLTARVWRSPSRVYRGLKCVAPASEVTVQEPQGDSVSSKKSELSNGVLPDTLQLGELLGKGTFGEVYRGIDTTSGEEYAVKVISKRRSGNDAKSIDLVMQRVEHEVSMWCELQNFTSAVRLEKFYEDKDQVYLVQELCSGGSLQDLMTIRGSLSEIETAHVMTTVLSMLIYCHERGICYLDVKPANFILPKSFPSITGFSELSSTVSHEFIKVIDFGSCEHIPKRGLRGPRGTPLYNAPEIQHSRYGAESDLWSAGVMMYYLLSGEMPFIGKPNKQLNPSALNFYIAHGKLKFDGDKWGRVSPEAKELISTMLNRSVKKRITAKEALEHPWIKRKGTGPTLTASFSDICPMDASAKALNEIETSIKKP
eukprot:g2894.t1